MEQEEPIDWIYPPPESEEESLWVALHDAAIVDLKVDAALRTARIEFDIPYLWGFHGLADSTRLYFDFSNVKALRAEESAPWPGGFSEIEDEAGESREKRLKEYWSKSILRSINFSEFQAKLEEAFRANRSFTVLQPDLLRSDSSVSLRILGFVNEYYPTWFVRAESVAIYLSNGKHMNVDQLIEFGGRYWEAFGKRNNENK